MMHLFIGRAPQASTGACVNFMTEEAAVRIKSAYGANYARLVEIKKQYDRKNLFHMNRNVRPWH